MAISLINGSVKWLRKRYDQSFEPKMVRDLDGQKLYPMGHQVMAMIFDVHLSLEYSQISIAR